MKTGINWFGQESPLLVQPAMAKAIGLHEALFVQQLDYWLHRHPHIRNERKWIYNTYEEWHNQFPFWSIRTIKRIVSGLRKNGIIALQPPDATCAPTPIHDKLTADPSKPIKETYPGVRIGSTRCENRFERPHTAGETDFTTTCGGCVYSAVFNYRQGRRF